MTTIFNLLNLLALKLLGGALKLIVIPDVEEVQSTSAIVAKIRAGEQV